MQIARIFLNTLYVFISDIFLESLCTCIVVCSRQSRKFYIRELPIPLYTAEVFYFAPAVVSIAVGPIVSFHSLMSALMATLALSPNARGIHMTAGAVDLAGNSPLAVSKEVARPYFAEQR